MEEQQLQHENKMGTMHIPQLLFSMALPAIISMFVQAMYNIVDSVFVAQTGENALTAVSLAFPVQMLIVSCFVGMGVGINSGISRRLGEKKTPRGRNGSGTWLSGRSDFIFSRSRFRRCFFKYFCKNVYG
ncbi:MATE family efflux transporter [Eubacterium callanderi]|uniref:MATE family efflux transporter n=1 Tax=Eubacterium callanderi TaxID=53442 RepID=UPI001FA76680|nr:MATE family efflux transporter [Eubacterium callanderi]